MNVVERLHQTVEKPCDTPSPNMGDYKNEYLKDLEKAFDAIGTAQVCVHNRTSTLKT